MMHTRVIPFVRPGAYPAKVHVLGCLRAMGLVINAPFPRRGGAS